MKFIKKSIFIVLIFNVLVFSAKAGEKTKGYYITFNNDSVNVEFDIPIVKNGLNKKLINFEQIQCKIPFVTEGQQSAYISPQDAKLVAFTWNREQVVMYSKSASTIKQAKSKRTCPKVFLQKEIDGYLQLYYFYYTHSGPGMQDAGFKKYYLQKGDDILFTPKVGVKHFSKEMSEYLSDCKYVSNQIKAKTLRENDLRQIIKDYNSACER